MRSIKQTAQFKRDLKREAKGQYRKTLESDLMSVLTALASNVPLDKKHCDHALSGDKRCFRDCHIKPDLILLYQKPDKKTLILVRLGSHSELCL